MAGAINPPETLGEDEGFEAAVGEPGRGLPAALYLLPSLLEIAEQGGSAADPHHQAAAPYLAAFESLAAGSRLTEALGVTRLTVSLGE